MTVQTNDRVTADVTNAAFMSRTADTSTTGKVDLVNAGSAPIIDLQQTLNQLGGANIAGRFNLTSWTGTAISAEEFSEKVYLYGAEFSSSMKLSLIVPSSYSASLISLNCYCYSPSSSNDWKMETVSTIIKPEVDAIDSITNQFVYSGSLKVNTGANIIRKNAFNLTDGTGLINGVQVLAGDIITVELRRIVSGGTDDSAEVRFVTNLTELII